MSPTKEVLVRHVMTPQVRTVRRNDPLLEADRLMKSERIRHLPVVDEEDVLVGVLSQRDLFHSGLLKALGHGPQGIEKMLGSLLVKEVMTEPVLSTTAEAPLRSAARMMLDHKLGCLPVLEGNEIVGILTESNFVALWAEREGAHRAD